MAPLSENPHARILVVEDDEAVGRQIQGLLGRAGYDAHVEQSGEGALAFASEQTMDLVILDLVLPDMSGYDICRELRQRYHPWKLPVLMLTALNQPSDKLLGFSHGADAYLMKPVAASELLSAVEVLLTRAEPGS